MMIQQDNISFLKSKFAFISRLSKAEQEELFANTSQISYKKAQNIHSAENDCIGVLLVKSGELRAYILSEGGKEATLYRLYPGDVCILSASCLMHNITFDVFIDAEIDSEILLVGAGVFAKLQNSSIYVENFALSVMVDKFSDVMWAMEQILFKSFDSRLATFLLDESAKRGSDRIDLTHEQIAKYMASAREVVSRMIKYFEKEKLVTLHRGGLTITDKAGLRKLI
jgi:CRP/FNR family transcriptional regulator, anaerobic regulatory protein